MLGLKLNHVSKRGHWSQQDTNFVIVGSTTGPYNDNMHMVRATDDDTFGIITNLAYFPQCLPIKPTKRF